MWGGLSPTDVLGCESSPSHTHATHTLNLQFATLKGHNNDVQDCSWSSDGSALVTGGVDNLSCLFDLSKRRGGLQRAAETLDGHTHYVMGCAWDPKGEFVATQSADKTARLYTRAGGAAPPSGPACSQFVLANVLANRTGRPAVGGAAIGVFTLVPDGMAELNGVTAALMHRGEGGLLASLTLTASIVQTCVTIGAGIFIASMLVSPRELTHTHGAEEPAAAGGALGRVKAALLGLGRRNRGPAGRRRKYGRSRAMPLFF